jgi:CheY-like chemotaxis protein
MVVLLLVDDDTELRDILEMALSGLPDLHVISASSGEAALQTARLSVPDLVVTDYRMDGITGIELLQALRASEVWPTRGAIVMSGDDDPELERKAMDAGAMAFWRKPLATAKLRQAVREILAGG